MLKRLGSSLSLAIAPNRVVLVQHSGGRKGSNRLAAQWQGEPLARAPGNLVGQVATVLAQGALTGQVVRVVLADALLRSWTVEPPGNASRLQDCEAAAAMRFTAVFGDSPADWHISAAYDARFGFLACALKRTLRDGLLQALQDQRLRLLSMEPECVALWNHWQAQLPADAWLGLYSAGSLLLGVVVAGRMQGTRRLALAGPEGAGKDWLERAVQREAARLNLKAPEALGLCGKVPTDWLRTFGGTLRCTLLGEVCDALTLLGVPP
jgi:hypothetical protein